MESVMIFFNLINPLKNLVLHYVDTERSLLSLLVPQKGWPSNKHAQFYYYSFPICNLHTSPKILEFNFVCSTQKWTYKMYNKQRARTCIFYKSKIPQILIHLFENLYENTRIRPQHRENVLGETAYTRALEFSWQEVPNMFPDFPPVIFYLKSGLVYSSDFSSSRSTYSPPPPPPPKD